MQYTNQYCNAIDNDLQCTVWDHTHTHTMVHSGADNPAIALHFLSLPLSTSPYLFLPLFSLLEDWTKNFSIWICSVVCYLSFCGSIHNNFVSGSTKLLYVFPQQLQCVVWWCCYLSGSQSRYARVTRKQADQTGALCWALNKPTSGSQRKELLYWKQTNWKHRRLNQEEYIKQVPFV